MEDFPAAHSMDTTWFAIDRDGNLAVFDSGEAGAVPEETIADQGFPHEDELRALPATGVLMDPDGHRAANGGGHLEINDFNVQYGALVFVKDTSAIADLLPKLEARELPATKGKALIIRLTDAQAFAQLHERGACLGCDSHYRDDDDDDIARYGLYRYSHITDNWIAGPYARLAVPAKPVPLAQLPRELRDGAIRFDGRFADTPELQPAEHWRSVAWGAAWLATDRKTVRPLPDREDDFGEEVEQLDGVDDGLVYERDSADPDDE
jgi:hypothetical protein